MKVKLFDKEYVVEFAHDTVDKWTTASLHELVDGKPVETPVAVGEAFCYSKDIYSRKIGRKIAFAKMLEKAQRRLFKQQMWVEYFKNLPNDKK